jgi:diguanylate cyclase (GGDEF)-like protein/PAS domain S-box-containing protein
MSDDLRPDSPSDFCVPAEIEQLCMRNLLSNTEDKIFFKDRQSRFLLVSKGFLGAQGQGRSLDELIGKTDFDIFSRPHATAAFEDEQRVIETGEPIIAKVERETFHDRPDTWVSTTKLPLRDAQGNIIGTWGIARDITERIQAEQALVEQTLHDPVTGLTNRVGLMDCLARALVALERRPGRVAVLFADLDAFKQVNDSLGHDAGDQVLVEVARRLKHVARRADTVARLGGDEFVLLCPELNDVDNVALIGDRVIRAIRAPLSIDRHDMTVTTSLGAVVTNDPLADAGELLRRADIAMYGAKRAGRNRLEIFGADVHHAGES